MTNAAERILLAEELWDSVAVTQAAPPLTPAQCEELERRLAAADRGEMEYSSWAEVKRRLLPIEAVFHGSREPIA